MAAPWEDSRYPPFPTPYHPNGRPRNARPQQSRTYVPQAVPGFYSPAIFSDQQYGPPTPVSAQPISSIPTALKPGRAAGPPPLTGHRSYSKELSGDIFFGAPAFPQPQISRQQPYSQTHYPPPPQIRHSVSAPGPPIPQKPDFDMPPLPPKPPHSSPARPAPAPHSHSYNHPRPGATLGPAGDDSPRLPPKISTGPAPARRESDARELADLEAQDLERALQISAQAAERAKKQEEAELARALEESLQVSSPVQISSAPSFLGRTEQNIPSGATSSGRGYASSLPSSSPASSYLPLPSPSVPLPIAESLHEAQFVDDSSRYTSSPPSSFQQIKDDEEFARKLIEQERLSLVREECTAASTANVQAPATSSQHPHADPRLPRYDDVVPAHSCPSSVAMSKSAPATTHTSPNLAALPPLPQPGMMRQASQASLRSSTPPLTLGRSTSANAVPTIPTITHEIDSRAGRSQSIGAYVGRTAPRPPMPESLGDKKYPPSHQVPPGRPAPLPIVEESAPQPNQGALRPSTTSPPLNTNQFIDDELLRGVTIGFSPPVMATTPRPMQGPIPNFIGLPYGRAPPLHFKAPNWHDMLKLMARMSGTRLQATVEAMAVRKEPMQLRIVVNFVKIHQNLPDWHVILYMTIDMPVPQENRMRFRNLSDPALLPYSYSLSPTPAFLRENADGPMSKWYTIPSTTQNPYPTLPITFPDVATYLMSAVENSRRAAHDRSSGWHRLAKYVDTLYPMLSVKDDEEEERTRLSERFGRLFGRGSKAPRHDNDERSNLVTPFYADEFGR